MIFTSFEKHNFFAFVGKVFVSVLKRVITYMEKFNIKKSYQDERVIYFYIYIIYKVHYYTPVPYSTVLLSKFIMSG